MSRLAPFVDAAASIDHRQQIDIVETYRTAVVRANEGALGEADKMAAMTGCLQRCTADVAGEDDGTDSGALGRCRSDTSR